MKTKIVLALSIAMTTNAFAGLDHLSEVIASNSFQTQVKAVETAKEMQAVQVFTTTYRGKDGIVVDFLRSKKSGLCEFYGEIKTANDGTMTIEFEVKPRCPIDSLPNFSG